MWGIKIVSGLQTGQVNELKNGNNVVGRSEACDIPVSHPGISRKHFQITIKENIVILRDLNSVNGTFVNGVLVKRIVLSAGDKISCNNMIFEFHRMDYLKSLPSISNGPQQHHQQPPPTSDFNASEDMMNVHGNLAFQPQATPSTLATPEIDEHSPPAETTNKSFFTNIQDYFETVVMPGIYQLAQWAEFKWILGAFILIYILLVTLLAVFPLMQISEERILKESQLRAVEIAKGLAQRYRSAINQGLSSTFVVREERLEGVDTAMIIAANDGHILAPARKIGSHADVPFIHRARKKSILSIEQLQNNTIGVSIPIRSIDPDGESFIKAFSVLIYNVSVLKFEDVIRLFVQVLAFALSIGFILFILFYRLIEYPIRQMNIQMDQALKKGNNEISIDFNYPEIQKLSTNINSALSRIKQEDDDVDSTAPQISPEEEAQSLIQVIKTAGLVLDAEGTIIAINSECDHLISDHGTMLNRNINDISDQALQLNLQDLFQKVLSQYGQAASNELEFSGVNYIIEATCILDTQNPKFIVVTFSGQEAGGDF